LGGVKTLISCPYSMTHASVPKKEKEKLGITKNLLRLSVGIEDVDDLISELDLAINH
jgi:cystathionine beta-lyase/cystathionine gamma-synthase